MKVIIKEQDWIFPHCGIKPIVFCPKCGGGLLGDDAPHGVKENGDVYQSLVCRHPGCDFHAFVTLENWTHGAINCKKKQ